MEATDPDEALASIEDRRPKLQPRRIVFLDIDGVLNRERYGLAQTWLRIQRALPEAFAVIDDERPSEQLDQFWVRTDPEVGITVGDVQRLVSVLARGGP